MLGFMDVGVPVYVGQRAWLSRRWVWIVRPPGTDGSTTVQQRGPTVSAPDADCPPWCAEHVNGLSGLEHRVVVGDVQLTRTRTSGATLTRWAIRRKAVRSPQQSYRLWEDFIAASALVGG
jgi:hypothetical protein